MSKTMKCARFTTQGGKLEIAEVPIPNPGPGQVRIEVYACGVCFTDVHSQHGNSFPRIPGHEVAGVIDSVGEGVTDFKKGDKVGVGWFGGNHCGKCIACKEDTWVMCSRHKSTGGGFDGGYAEYMVVDSDAVGFIPKELDYKYAGPLCCAGITTYNAMRNSGVRAGDVCVIGGIGGLGHLAIQFAAKMGLNVVAVSNGSDKMELAKKLGAHVYLDNKTQNVVEEVQKLGGAKLIVATAPQAKAISELVPALGMNGKMMVVGIPQEPLSVNVVDLLTKRASIVGWPSGDSRDTEDCLKFSALTGVQPMIETFPLEKAQEAFDKMLSNQVRFRSVLICKKDYQ